jgi:ubiquinone/menaquinone biosynthesis C-methylase UbiE
MNPDWNEEDLKQIARQLSCPDGEAGITTGERMNVSNGNMIRRTIDELAINEYEKVAEIGPGNGSHVKYILDKAAGIVYTGLDISSTMVQEAEKLNAGLVESGTVAFIQSDGKTLAFDSNSFDKIFTVNTIYFWENPVQYASEIYRVLKLGGRFCVAFAHRDFMQKLPFTRYGFRLYDPETVEQLLRKAQFVVEHITQETEQIPGNPGQSIEREIAIVAATKV